MSQLENANEQKTPGLRCKTCGVPLDPAKAIRTPTGYSCKDCIRSREKVYVTAKWYDYIVAFVAAGGLSAIASFLVALLSGILWFFLLFFVSAAAAFVGGIIAEAVRFLVRKRRAKRLFQTAAVGTALGGILPQLPALIAALLYPEALFSTLFSILIPAIFVVLSTSVVYYRLAGIRLKW